MVGCARSRRRPAPRALLTLAAALAVLLAQTPATAAPRSAAAWSDTPRVGLAWRFPTVDMKVARGDLGAAVVGGKIYAIGGRTDSTALGTVEEYEPTTESWRLRTAMTTARSHFGLAVGANGKIYAIGGLASGAGGAALDVVEEYDPAADSWRTRAPMPTARYGLAAATAGDGRVYAVGGGTASCAGSTTVEAYDPATDSWSSTAGLAGPRTSHGLAAGPDGTLFAVGGCDAGTPLRTVEEYLPSENRWRDRVRLPSHNRDFVAMTSGGGKLFILGGRFLAANATQPVRTTEVYDVATEQWSLPSALPSPREGAAAAIVGDQLYVVGGRQFDTTLNILELATISPQYRLQAPLAGRAANPAR